MTTELSPHGEIEALIETRQGIMLDLGCGGNKQPGFVGMDVRELPGVDIVHDLNAHPWPLPDESVTRIMASHLVEHIPPTAITSEGTRFPFMEFMDEAWRVCQPGAEFLIAAPYYASSGFAQDPTHINMVSEVTFAYFDPLHHTGLWRIYQPKPWYYRFVSFNPAGNIEVVMMRHSEDQERWREERETWGPMQFGT